MIYYQKQTSLAFIGDWSKSFEFKAKEDNGEVGQQLGHRNGNKKRPLMQLMSSGQGKYQLSVHEDNQGL